MLVSVCMLSEFYLNYLGKKRTSVEVCWSDLFIRLRLNVMCESVVFALATQYHLFVLISEQPRMPQNLHGVVEEINVFLEMHVTSCRGK